MAAPPPPPTSPQRTATTRCAVQQRERGRMKERRKEGPAMRAAMAWRPALPRHDGAGRRRRHYSSGQRQPLAVHKEDREKRNARSGVAGLGPVPGPGGTPATHALVGRGRKQKGSSGCHGQPPLGGNRERGGMKEARVTGKEPAADFDPAITPGGRRIRSDGHQRSAANWAKRPARAARADGPQAISSAWAERKKLA